MATDKYIRFDWAAKRMLRDKAQAMLASGMTKAQVASVLGIEEDKL